MPNFTQKYNLHKGNEYLFISIYIPKDWNFPTYSKKRKWKVPVKIVKLWVWNDFFLPIKNCRKSRFDFNGRFYFSSVKKNWTRQIVLHTFPNLENIPNYCTLAQNVLHTNRSCCTLFEILLHTFPNVLHTNFLYCTLTFILENHKSALSPRNRYNSMVWE